MCIRDRLEPSQINETRSAECSNLIGHGQLTIQENAKVIHNIVYSVVAYFLTDACSPVLCLVHFLSTSKEIGWD